jgi:DNA-binding response OmpR family regulator
VAVASYRTRALRAGAAHYLVKPVEMTELLQRVEELVHSTKDSGLRVTPAGFQKSPGRASKKRGPAQSA